MLLPQQQMSQKTLHWSFTGWIARLFAPADIRSLRALRKPSEKLPKGTWLKSQSLSTLTLEGGATMRPTLQVMLAGKPFLQCALASGTFTYALVPAPATGLIFLGCFIHQYKVSPLAIQAVGSRAMSIHLIMTDGRRSLANFASSLRPARAHCNAKWHYRYTGDPP